MARKLLTYPWLAIRRDFARGDSLHVIAQRYSVRRATLQSHCHKERWEAPPPAPKPEPPAAEPTPSLDLSLSHEDVVAQLRGLVCTQMRAQAAGTLTSGNAQILESLTRSVATVLKLDREVSGKRLGTPSVENLAATNEPTTVLVSRMPSVAEFAALRAAGMLAAWQTLHDDDDHAKAAAVLDRAVANGERRQA